MEARQFRSSRRRGGVRVAAVDEQNVVSGWRQKLYRPQGCAPIYSLEVSTHPRSATMTLFYQPELLYMTNQSVSSCMGMNGIVDPSHSVAVVVVCMSVELLAAYRRCMYVYVKKINPDQILSS